MTGKSLDERVALVIGGSGGIGRALARGLARAGARVVIASSSEERVAKAVEALAAEGIDVSGRACDANDKTALETLVDGVAAERGRLDLLVNCQGALVVKPTAEITPEDYDRVMDTNLKSVFFACLAAYRQFKRQDAAKGGAGAIINIASLAAHRGWPRGVVYSLSKHGVLGLTRSLAAEWSAEGIRVNSISPGFFVTELNRAVLEGERGQKALARSPGGRFGELDELVSAALFLASPDSSFVTGADVPVDGGYLAAGI